MAWAEGGGPWHGASGVVGGSRESLPSSLLRCWPGDDSLGRSLWFSDAAVEAVGQGGPGSGDRLCAIVASACYSSVHVAAGFGCSVQTVRGQLRKLPRRSRSRR